MTVLAVLLGGAVLIVPAIAFDLVSQRLLNRGLPRRATAVQQSPTMQAEQQAARMVVSP